MNSELVVPLSSYSVSCELKQRQFLYHSDDDVNHFIIAVLLTLFDRSFWLLIVFWGAQPKCLHMTVLSAF